MIDRTQLASDQSDTPKTDAVTRSAQYWPLSAEVVPVHFARAQERRIAELEAACQEISELISGHDYDPVFDDIAKVLLGTKP